MAVENKEKTASVFGMEMVYLLIYLMGVLLCKPYITVLYFVSSSFLFVIAWVLMLLKVTQKSKRQYYKWLLFSINQVLICFAYLLYIGYMRLEVLWFLMFCIALVIVVVISILQSVRCIRKLNKLDKGDELDAASYEKKQKEKREKATLRAVPVACVGLFIGRILCNNADQAMIFNMYFVLMTILLLIMLICGFYLICDHYHKYLLNLKSVWRQ